jgi:Protein of unknown function (DUF2924)
MLGLRRSASVGSSDVSRRYHSLSEIARLITGTRWSGPLFFGLKGQQDNRSSAEVSRCAIEAKLKRSGGEVHLVIPPKVSETTSRQPNPSLTKAVARARGRYQRVLEGKSSDQRSLTLHAGVTERYIGKVFGRIPCARHRRSNPRRTSTSRPEF